MYSSRAEHRLFLTMRPHRGSIQKEIAALIEEYHIPAIFVEKNGSRATAEVIARETGCEIYELDMLMSGRLVFHMGGDGPGILLQSRT